jgi:exodeoxyribonuclease V gamma subunit
MEIRHAADAVHLAQQLAQLWSRRRDDPFTFDLAVVPSPGFQRWISQQLALADGPDGICAGVEFTSAARLRTQLFGAQDPWRPQRLAWLIQRIVLDPDCPTALSVLRDHLDASRETYSATTRIAGHFAGYAEHLPAMLHAWGRGEDVDPSGAPLADNAWQAELWRLLGATVGTDPVQNRAEVLARLDAGPTPDLPHRIAVLAPTQLSSATLELYQGLSKHHQLDLLLLTHSPSRRLVGASDLRRTKLHRPPGHPLNLTLGAIHDELTLLTPDPEVSLALNVSQHSDNLLGWLAADLCADRQPTPRQLQPGDRSIQVHLSHGPSRQIEVLREVLAELFAADPSLEPRHVAVLTPDVEAIGALLDAAFVPQPGAPGHPAQQFRLRLADRTLAQVNPLVGLLLTLLRLPDSRIEASTLLEFCAAEPVAKRFGFSIEARERLADLVTAAGIRWGLNATQRADYGLGGLAHNTWLSGLQRMLLGVALSEQDLVAVGTVLPLDDIDSSDIELIGALTELIGRLSRWLTEISQPATLTEWVSRCRAGLDALISLAPASEWQLADLLAGLARLAESGDASGQTKISRHAALTAIENEFRTSPARGAFGNGSAVVAGLSSLRNVPHRVIVLLGWDADRYPRTGRRHGDDLLGLDPPIGSPSPALTDRGALLDAIHAASDHLVVIGRGRSEATNAEVPLAAPIAELLEALDATAVTAAGRPASQAITVHHPLQPFAAEYFTAGSGLRSVDQLAFRAAQVCLVDVAPPRDRYALEPLEPLNFDQGINLDELTGFFRHPARALLKTRTGISLGDTDQPSDEIPVEPNGLERWQIGNRVLRRLNDGIAPQLVERAEWLRGQVPPFELGRQVMSSVLADARRTLAGAPPPGESTQHDLQLSVPVPGLGEVNLVGRIPTREHTLWQVEYSSLQPRQKLTSWIRLLALAAAEPGEIWDARVIGKGYRVRYAAPPAPVALELLGRYLAIYSLGMTRPLPALPRLNAEWANLRATGRDPHDPYLTKSLRRCWDWESDLAWGKFFDYPDVLALPLAELDIPGAAQGETTLLGALATSIWAPVLAAEVAS